MASLGGTGISRPAEGRRAADPHRWWARSDRELWCPVTLMPLSLLPYPPFKLRIGPEERLVDGKMVALYFIINEQATFLGAPLTAQHVAQLDGYMKKRHLGQLKPGRALRMLQAIADERDPVVVTYIREQLEELRTQTRAEAERLRSIQETRLRQLYAEGKTVVMRLSF